MLSTIDTVIIVKVWTVNNVVEEVVMAMALEAPTMSVVEIVEAAMEAKSVTVLWAIEES